MEEEPSYEEIETQCPNCKIKFKLKDMRLSPETNRMYCINCFMNPGAKLKRIR